jgi:hypothetical protein
LGKCPVNRLFLACAIKHSRQVAHGIHDFVLPEDHPHTAQAGQPLIQIVSHGVVERLSGVKRWGLWEEVSFDIRSVDVEYREQVP